MRRLIFTGAALLVLIVVATASFAERGGKTATFAERRGLKFSHNFHAENADLKCEDCHVGAAASPTGGDNLLPGHAQCASCHEVESANECATCHLESTPRKYEPITQFSAKFSHAKHAGVNIACESCHSGLDEPLTAGKQLHAPHMAECMSCHADHAVKDECMVCHVAIAELRPSDHGADWVHRHGLADADMTANCAMCHTSGSDLDCQACHQGDAVLTPHPRNYLFRHGQDAHLSDTRCATCHEQRSFCADCHVSMNVLPADHFRPGWVSASGGAHGEAAEFDLESCMSCHDSPGREPVCATCHVR